MRSTSLASERERERNGLLLRVAQFLEEEELEKEKKAASVGVFSLDFFSMPFDRKLYMPQTSGA